MRLNMKKRFIISTIFLVVIIALSGDEQEVERYDIPLADLEKSEIEIEFGLGSLEIRSGNSDYLLRGAALFEDARLKPRIRHKKIGNRSNLHIYNETADFNGSFNSV